MTEHDVTEIKAVLVGIYMCLLVIMGILLYPIIGGWKTFIAVIVAGVLTILQSERGKKPF